MKILYCITKGNFGGAQRYVRDLSLAARDAGHDVAVAFGEPGILEEKLRQAGIRTIVLPGMRNEASLGALWHAYRDLRHTFLHEKPDIVHLNSSLVGASGSLAARMAGVPRIIFTTHGWLFMERRSLPVRTLFWLASWITALFSHRIICVSDSELRLARSLPFCASKAVRIYNGIDLHAPLGSGASIRAAFPKGVHITGTIGDLTANKNQIALVEEARKNPDMYVAIVGEGHLRPMLERKIHEYGLGDRVKLFGFMPAADVLKGFDTFALPSIKEGLAYVVLEARAAGLPVVANRIGGIGEAVDRPLSEFSIERMIEQTFAVYREKR